MSLELQELLFGSAVSRTTLLNYEPSREKTVRIQVFRNHSFELVEHTIGAYLDYAGIGAEFTYSGYDDSFSFLELDPDADLVLVWVDTSRYKGGSAADMLKQRLEQLGRQFLKPILLVPYGEQIQLSLPGVTVFDLTGIQQEMGQRFTDLRASAVTGTPLSSKAMMRISKELGLRYLPALLTPGMKAVVVDLDNTLYKGVLGEDGAAGLELTEGHARLQEYLKELSDKGFFLCAASKNDQRDVEALFEQRPDFPLKKEDFTIICASWDPKAQSVGKIAQFLNIAPDSMVFVDDNIGELMAMQMAYPSMRIVHALADGGATRSVLEYFPGLFKLKKLADDDKRKSDVQANARRQQMQSSMSHEEYIRSLGITLDFHIDDPAHAVRVAELANKTNQFIFSYQRYTLPQVEALMRSPASSIVTVSLSDRLSDSGLIGVCVGKKQDDSLLVEECFVSCRALGRGIDDVIVLGAIRLLADRLGCGKVQVLFKTGPRNTPAENFVQEHLADKLSAPGAFSFEMPEGLLTIHINGRDEEK